MTTEKAAKIADCICGKKVHVGGSPLDWYAVHCACGVEGQTKETEAEAIAAWNLLVAAPDLLAALKEAEWHGVDFQNRDACPLCYARKGGDHGMDCKLAAAIAKAEGREP